MSATPREIGTLIVVVLRANHLPNKRHIGKQDPYCLVTVNGEKRRTKAIKRGGQHPEWDEEIRFTLFEDVEDVLARTAHGHGTPPPPPPKDDKKIKRIKGGKTMKVACYADDPREPDLIGDVEVDLTEVLTKGETDALAEWFTLTNKDKFAGKVYLELTFWSNEPAPERKVTPKPPKNNKQYGGPGSFVPSGELPPGSRIASASAAYDNHSRQSSDVIPSVLRASSSAANLNLYVAPYERNHNPPMDSLARDFSEFGVSAPRRRESFPPVPGQYSQQPQHLGGGHSTFTTYPASAYGYDQSIPESTSIYPYDRPLTPNGQTPAHYHQPSTGTLHGYPSQTYQHPAYEVASPTSYQSTTRGPRHSVPTASSGFVPLPQASGFVPFPSHVSEPSGFAPPLSHTPVPTSYISQFHPHSQPVYPPPVSHTPAPPNNDSYLQHSTSLSFPPQQSFSASQSYNYGIPPSASVPPQQFISSPQSNIPPPAASAPPQLYTAMSSSHEMSPAQAPPPVQPPHNGQSSRPLPQQPQVVYTQQPIQSQPIATSHSLPPPNNISQTVNSYSPTQPGDIYPSNNGYSSIPPPPPPPPLQYNSTASVITKASNLPVPPPPPPPPSSLNVQPRRHASLPQPPVAYQQQQQQPMYQQQPQPPPPPPPPMEYYGHSPLPPPPPPLGQGVGIQNTTYPQSLPPKPPAQVDEYGQWTHPADAQQTSQPY
ncbi:hypothetical protein BDZ97DRAFT_1647414 [Flammula alnicola]|nr:hypothetical protein BDZ97DRAFT_1647414 [Flammula alnicola]